MVGNGNGKEEIVYEKRLGQKLKCPKIKDQLTLRLGRPGSASVASSIQMASLHHGGRRDDWRQMTSC